MSVGALGVTAVLHPPAYTVSVITAAGRVLAWALATLPASPSPEQCSAPGCNRMAYPLTSTSDSRVYFLDGDTTVKYLTPTGQTGQATTISAGPKTLAAFSVSPDDRRIAVSLMDYSALPSGEMSLQLYAEDLAGGNRVTFFSAKGIVEWPIGWRSGQLVLAVGGGADAAAANPYSATEYHVVNPANGDRSAIIGHPAGAPGAVCNSGPLVSAGTGCVSVSFLPDHPDLGFIDFGFVDWSGNYTFLPPRYPHTSLNGVDLRSGNRTLALSPNGSTLAVQLGGIQGLTFLCPGGCPWGVGTPLGWIDEDHLVVRHDGQLRVYEPSSKALRPLGFDGIFAGVIPGGLDPAGVPRGRGAAQLAYDTANHQAVLFGGSLGYGSVGDTWTWNGSRWSLVQTDVAPSPRQGAAFIYDPLRHVSLLFGGAPGMDPPGNDTWTFDGRRWSQQLTQTSPSPREFSAVTFDSRRGVVVLYGGWSSGRAINDIWTWDGKSWTQLASSASAPAVFPMGLAYRQATDTYELVGQAVTGGTIYPTVQVWTFDQKSWREATSAQKAPCLDHYGASADDPQRGVLVFFGGYCKGAAVQWDGTKWTETPSTPSPPNRGNANLATSTTDEAGRPAMVYDPDHRIVLLFGGVAGDINGIYYNDLWAWDGAGWTKVG